MKLPENKSERIKLLILICLAAAGLLFAFWFGLSHMVKEKKDKTAQIGELDEKIRKANAAVNQARRGMDANTRILEEIADVANRRNFVLHDRLGNYLLGAQEILDAYARSAGVTLDSVVEVGQSQIPGTSVSTNGPAFRSYTVRVSLHAGMHDFIKLLTQIEKGNPFLCVSSITINGNTAKPDVHDISFDVQWPIWSSAEASDQIEAQLKAIEQDSRSAATQAEASPK